MPFTSRLKSFRNKLAVKLMATYLLLKCNCCLFKHTKLRVLNLPPKTSINFSSSLMNVETIGKCVCMKGSVRITKRGRSHIARCISPSTSGISFCIILIRVYLFSKSSDIVLSSRNWLFNLKTIWSGLFLSCCFPCRQLYHVSEIQEN